MLNLHFMCPKCQEFFTICGWWKWILTSPFHWFRKRYTKCPYCKARSWMAWYEVSRE